MTASTHAIGAPVTILPARPRARSRSRARRPVTRQLRARRLLTALAGLCAVTVIAGTAQQLVAHGWRAFVFRAPGVGGTPPTRDTSGHTSPPPAARATAPLPTAAQPTAAHQHRQHHHLSAARHLVPSVPASASATTRQTVAVPAATHNPRDVRRDSAPTREHPPGAAMPTEMDAPSPLPPPPPRPGPPHAPRGARPPPPPGLPPPPPGR